MVIYQAFNKRNKAWVKFKLVRGGIKILDVKQRKPMIKFKGIPIKGQRK